MEEAQSSGDECWGWAESGMGCDASATVGRLRKFGGKVSAAGHLRTACRPLSFLAVPGAWAVAGREECLPALFDGSLLVSLSLSLSLYPSSPCRLAA